MEEMNTGEGTIEMIRKTPGGSVEEFQVKGTQLINGNGVWCYQIPMNLDYMMTDEYGNMIPTDDPSKGIPTRTCVRFRISMQDNDDKIKKYVEVAEAEGIKIIVPDINISNEKFTPNAENKSIYYGLSSIKGVGDAALSEIIANKPYMSIDDLFEKLPKKVLNKRVALALAKSGALDSFDINKDRCAIINEIMKKRKEKDFVSYPDRYYCDEVCMEFETEVLSVPITCKPWWSTVNTNSRLTKQKATIVSVREQQDKNKNLMAFAKLRMNNCEVEAVIFAKTYTSSIGLFDPNVNLKQEILVNGKKDDKGKLVISKVFSAKDEPEDAFDI
jgi:DNA polymerase-3 subunit alpha